MRVLVTGAGGFLGLALTKSLTVRGDTVIAFDSVIPPGLQALAATRKNLAVHPGDITDMVRLYRVFRDEQPEAVIHCAAVVGVVASLASPVNVLRVNIEGTINLFEVMALHDVRRVLHISSEETYGAFEAAVITEDHTMRPLYAYGVTKVAVEHLGRSYRLTHGIECINIRTSWVYGPDFPRMRAPRDMVEAALNGRPLHLSSGAASAIDHTYVDDFVAGTIAALDHREHPYDAYHIASGTAPTLAEMAAIVRELVPGADISVGPGVYRHGGVTEIPRKGALDCTRAAKVFGYAPAFDLRRGLQAYIRSYGQ